MFLIFSKMTTTNIVFFSSPKYCTVIGTYFKVKGEGWVELTGDSGRIAMKWNCLWVNRHAPSIRFHLRLKVLIRPLSHGEDLGCHGRVTTNQSLHNNAALFCVAELLGDGARIPAAGSEGRSLASVKPSGKSLTFATPRWSGVTAK